MDDKTQTLLEEASRLSRDQQLELAEQLIALQAIGDDDPEAALLPELNARWDAFERGDDVGTEAFAAIDDMRDALKDRRNK